MNAAKHLFEVPRPLAFIEEQEVLKALAYTDGNVSDAAKLLGVARQTVHRILQRMGFSS